MKSFILLSLFVGLTAESKIKVITTTSDLKSLTAEVTKDLADVSNIAKGTLDPHYIEAKPSFMIQVRDSDLIISNGLSLEIGWLPNLVRGARNPKIAAGSNGYLDLGSFVTSIDKPSASVTRAQGDVHPEGNPHYTLDPVRNGENAKVIADRLSALDAKNKDAYVKNAEAFNQSMIEKTKAWKKRIEATKIKKVITYHPTLNYFMQRFGLEVPINLEDKPGVPPSAQHILNVIKTAKDQNIKVIFVDNFFDTKIAERVKKEVPEIKIYSVGIAVDSKPELKKLEDVTEQFVKILEDSAK